jgi:hypothetical protein
MNSNVLPTLLFPYQILREKCNGTSSFISLLFIHFTAFPTLTHHEMNVCRTMEFIKLQSCLSSQSLRVWFYQVLPFNYEAYPQNKFCLKILPLQRCGHYGAHVCRLFWSFWKVRMQFADSWTMFMHHPVCLKCSRKTEKPTACEMWSVIRFLNVRNMKLAEIRQLMENMPWVIQQ